MTEVLRRSPCCSCKTPLHDVTRRQVRDRPCRRRTAVTCAERRHSTPCASCATQLGGRVTNHWDDVRWNVGRQSWWRVHATLGTASRLYNETELNWTELNSLRMWQHGRQKLAWDKTQGACTVQLPINLVLFLSWRYGLRGRFPGGYFSTY